MTSLTVLPAAHVLTSLSGAAQYGALARCNSPAVTRGCHPARPWRAVLAIACESSRHLIDRHTNATRELPLHPRAVMRRTWMCWTDSCGVGQLRALIRPAYRSASTAFAGRAAVKQSQQGLQSHQAVGSGALAAKRHGVRDYDD